MILIITLMVQKVHFSPLVYSQHTVNSATSGEEVVVEFRSELRRTLLLSTSIKMISITHGLNGSPFKH